MAAAVLDANVILRHLLHDKTLLSEEADQILLPIKSGQAEGHILEAVLAECVFVLMRVYKVKRREIAAELLTLLDYRGMIGSRLPIFREALILFSQSSVSIVDALLVTTAQAKGWAIKSFDADLNKLASRRLESR